MKIRLLFLAVFLAFFGSFASAQALPPEEYSTKTSPLDDLSRELLVETGHELREDGKVWNTLGNNAVRREEMAYLLSRLAGARRLKALLELNLLLNRSAGEKKLSDTERETIRALLRKHWAVFGVGTRKDFRSYFSSQELNTKLDKIPQRFDRETAIILRDPDPALITAEPSAIAAAAPISTMPTAPPLALFGSVLPPQTSGNPELGLLKPWSPPNPTPAPTLPATASIPTAALVPPPPAEATPAEFDAVIANGPYSRESQALLKMLGENAPEFCRALLRRTIVHATPLIVIDGARTGNNRRAGLAPASSAQPSATIALSAGPLIVERKKGLFGRTAIVLPEDPRAWKELGLELPTLEALRKDSVPVGQENGAWAMTRIYADHSRHGTYSPQEQAGELLEQLLLLGLAREGLEPSSYAARSWARVARLLFTARIVANYGNDLFLDPDRKLEFQDWTLRGDEAADLLAASWASSRGNRLDPRDNQALDERQALPECVRTLLAASARALAARTHAVSALVKYGLTTSEAARTAAEKAASAEASARAKLLATPPDCAGRLSSEENSRRRSSALLAESARAEGAFRELARAQQ